MVNLVVNACLIPSMKSMGAVIGTLAAELTVPLVQYIILRKELPYKRYLSYVALYAVVGGVMLGCVRLVGSLLPAENWLTLGVMTITGILVYGALCLLIWQIKKKSGKSAPL